MIRDIEVLTDKVKHAAETLQNEFPDVFITETGRTKEQQAENVRKGVSWTMDSYHLMNPQARAFDIAFHGDELYPSDISKWKPVWKKMKECGMDNGYDMWGKDWMHFQCDGSEFNKEDMTLSHDYIEIMKNEVEQQVFSEIEVTEEGQIKALIEISMDRLIESDKFKEAVLSAVKEELNN